MSVNLRDRVELLCSEIEERRAEITQQQKIVAEEWLKELGNQCAQMYKLLDDEEKLLLADDILQQIQIQKDRYAHLLNPLHQQSLEYIENKCHEEQNKNKTNQILVMFRQLSRLQRQNLYDRLGQELLYETEGLHD